MPHALTLDRISADQPDGAPLFHDLILSTGPSLTGIVGRNGAGKSTLFDMIAGRRAPTSGAVSHTGRIGEMRQHADRAGRIADALGLSDGLSRLVRIEAGEGSEEDFDLADWMLPERAIEALNRVGLTGFDLDQPTAPLSGGERTRLDIARLIIEQPDILLLDEPTNNLDALGRALVRDLIASWDGIVLVASHDRALLEVMDRIIHLAPTEVTMVTGGWSDFAAHRERQLEQSRADKTRAEREITQSRRESQQQIERQQRRAQTGKKARAQRSQSKLLLNAQKERSEQTQSRDARQAQKRLEQAETSLETARQRIEILTPLHIDLPEIQIQSGKILIDVDQVSIAHDDRVLATGISAEITPGSRWALKGANGSGKTSLIRCLMGEASPSKGTIARAEVPMAWLNQAQEFPLPSSSLIENLKALHPDLPDHDAHAILARFAFRNSDAEKPPEILSGGEKMRASFALAFSGPNPPQLLILDEPTNHLDIDSTETLEQALRGYQGALIVVSHDDWFLRAIACDREIQL